MDTYMFETSKRTGLLCIEMKFIVIIICAIFIHVYEKNLWLIRSAKKCVIQYCIYSNAAINAICIGQCVY